MKTRNVKHWIEQALNRHKVGDLNGAEALYRQTLQAAPNNADALHYMGVLQHQRGNNDLAIDLLSKAAVRTPSNAAIHFNLGVVLQTAARLKEAAKHYQASIKLNPQFAMAHNNLGSVWEKFGDFKNAEKMYQKALALDPQCVEALNNTGNIVKLNDRLSDAAGYYNRALALNPGYAEAHNNLGTILEQQGKPKDAEAHYRTALRLKPAFATAHSNLLFNLNYHHDRAPDTIFVEHLQYARQHTSNVPRFDHADTRRARRHDKIRVGYISPDFRTHSVAYFIEPVLRHHDRKHFDVFCYANVAKPDAVTSRLKGLSDQWRDITTITDQCVAQQIYDDEIDILVDLAGHTAGNRLGIFAYKPAPLQTTYLGYPNTTGLAEMDYRITDAWTDPPGDNDGFHTEKLLRVDHGFLCYQPPPEYPEIATPPALTNGYITFGSFNNLAKMTPQVIEAWADILRQTPASRLLLKAKGLGDENTRQEILNRFQTHGIGAERIELLGHATSTSDHLSLYRRIDIGLDPFPYNGTTTTCEALWMGVPVIVAVGRSHAARVGYSLLTSLSLDEFAADSRDKYIRTATTLAADQARLIKLRTILRERMRKSPLMDAAGFTRRLEQGYLAAWRDFMNG